MRSNRYPTTHSDPTSNTSNTSNHNKNLVSTIIVFTVIESILLLTVVGAFVMGYIGVNFLIIGLVAATLVFMMGVVPAILKNKRNG